MSEHVKNRYEWRRSVIDKVDELRPFISSQGTEFFGITIHFSNNDVVSKWSASKSELSSYVRDSEYIYKLVDVIKNPGTSREKIVTKFEYIREVISSDFLKYDQKYEKYNSFSRQANILASELVSTWLSKIPAKDVQDLKMDDLLSKFKTLSEGIYQNSKMRYSVEDFDIVKPIPISEEEYKKKLTDEEQ